LAAAGVCIVSGLALGIDAAAHRGALDAGAPTVGILGGGLGHFYPRSNRGLAEEIVAGGGGVASPFEDTMPARPAQFLQRNAVIAGLADAVVVVEAAIRSGALNTAAWAADASKPVMAFPGDVDRPKVAGCLALIHDGALLVRHAADVLAALPWYVAPAVAPAASRRGQNAGENALERRVLAALSDGEHGLDGLCAALDEPPARLLAALADLELAGSVSRRDGTRYAIC
jgi:DNA processing protein